MFRLTSIVVHVPFKVDTTRIDRFVSNRSERYQGDTSVVQSKVNPQRRRAMLPNVAQGVPKQIDHVDRNGMIRELSFSEAV